MARPKSQNSQNVVVLAKVFRTIAVVIPGSYDAQMLAIDTPGGSPHYFVDRVNESAWIDGNEREAPKLFVPSNTAT